jgi:hypothetical protein
VRDLEKTLPQEMRGEKTDGRRSHIRAEFRIEHFSLLLSDLRTDVCIRTDRRTR